MGKIAKDQEQDKKPKLTKAHGRYNEARGMNLAKLAAKKAKKEKKLK